MAYNFSPKVSTDGLILYLDGAKYTNGSTTWNDISRLNNTPSIVNSITYSQTGLGVVNTNGTGNILPPSSINGFEYGTHWDVNWSLEYWFRPDWNIGAQTYKALWYGYYGAPYTVHTNILILNANTISSASLNISINSESNSISISTPYLGSNINSIWSHLIIASNGINIKVYFNGVLKSTTTTNWLSDIGRMYCVEDIKIDTNDKILVAGGFLKYNDSNIGYGLVRLNTNGSKDDTFIPPSYSYRVNSIGLTNSSPIYTGGFFNFIDPKPYPNPVPYISGLVSISSTGSTTNYILPNQTPDFNQQNIYRLKINPINNKVYISTNVVNRFYRFNSDLTYDATYNALAFNALTYGFDIDTSGNLYIGGAFTSYGGTTSQYIVKLDINGNMDTSFNATSGFNNSVLDVKIDSNGKILTCGNYTTYKGTTVPRIARLNTDGTRDISFTYSTGFNNTCNVIGIDSNNKIYVGGDFTTFNGVTASRIVRLNSDGTIDNTFNSGVGFDGTVRTITIDSSNKIYVGGRFFNYNNISANGIVKLNTDGTIDTSFDYGTGFTRINARPISTTPQSFPSSQSIGGYIIGYTKLEIGSFKVYNRQLNDYDAMTNYNATRGRYGI